MAKELKSATDLLLGAPKQTKKAAADPAPAPAPVKVTEYEDYEEQAEFKTERTQILFRKSTKRALKQLAKKKTGGSLNELVNRICEKYIEENKEA